MPDLSVIPLQPSQALTIRTGGDGSFSLWSERFAEGFHSARGALREAHETFLNPSQLERFPPGRTLRVLEVCVGTGSNLAVLLEACRRRGLQLDWIGLELDPEPMRLALSQQAFRAPWPAQTLVILEQLRQQGEWHTTGCGSGARPATPSVHATQASAREPDGAPDGMPGGVSEGGPAGIRCSGGWGEAHGTLPNPPGRGRILWGDARQTLRHLGRQDPGPFDLIWHDAFSPQRCPQLWTLEFLRDLTSLLGPGGRWISYCSAAAVREALRLAGLQLVALPSARDRAHDPQAWSGGSVASPSALPASPLWRALSPMELEHLSCSAAEPYRDPTGSAPAEAILSARQQAQAEALASGRRGSSSAWRRRWGLEESVRIR